MREWECRWLTDLGRAPGGDSHIREAGQTSTARRSKKAFDYRIDCQTRFCTRMLSCSRFSINISLVSRMWHFSSSFLSNYMQHYNNCSHGIEHQLHATNKEKDGTLCYTYPVTRSNNSYSHRTCDLALDIPRPHSPLSPKRQKIAMKNARTTAAENYIGQTNCPRKGWLGQGAP